jgi:hypothetical protein
MRRVTYIFIAATVTACGALQAQNVVYQQAGAISADGNITISTGGPLIQGFGMISAVIPGGRPVTGSPFSATEQRHSLQILGDGSHIEQTNSVQLSRDSEGRTRREVVPQHGDTPVMVTIEDPVAAANYFLDPVHKTANKLTIPKPLSARVVSPSGGPGLSDSLTTAPAAMSASMASPSTTVRVTGVAGERSQVMALQLPESGGTVTAPVQEDLGTQNLNGVLAKGTRSTITIPVGQIGNDHALQVVDERWYSDELGMAVKSSNSDPRFGTTTYELTNISLAAPDPSLFQIPADYSTTDSKAVLRGLKAK